MTWVMVDIEADGPCPGLYSMVSLGAVVVEDSLDRSFYGQLRPISERWLPAALEVAGHSREETLAFPPHGEVMRDFAAWLAEVRDGGGLRFVSDNNGFDWQFINYYFHEALGQNPFGHSSTNLGSLYKGLVKTTRKNFKHLRKTRHTHHPVDDAKGNAEAMLEMERLGLRFR